MNLYIVITVNDEAFVQVPYLPKCIDSAHNEQATPAMSRDKQELPRRPRSFESTTKMVHISTGRSMTATMRVSRNKLPVMVWYIDIEKYTREEVNLRIDYNKQ